MPSGMRSSNASGSLPRRSRAASSRTSPPWIAARATPEPRATSMSRPRLTAAAWTDTPRAGRLRLAAVAAVLALLLGLAGCGGGDDQNDQVVGSTRISSADAMVAGATHPRPAGARRPRPRPRPVPAQGRPQGRRVDGAPAPLLPQPGAAAAGPVPLQGDLRAVAGPGHRQELGRRRAVPQVALTMQLRDFDAVPVERTVGFVFSFDERPGHARLRPHRSGKPLFRGNPAPWDLTAISVREEPGVLGIFDRRTRGSAATVIAAVRDGIDQLDRACRSAGPARSSSTASRTRACSRPSATCPAGRSSTWVR